MLFSWRQEWSSDGRILSVRCSSESNEYTGWADGRFRTYLHIYFMGIVLILSIIWAPLCFGQWVIQTGRYMFLIVACILNIILDIVLVVASMGVFSQEVRKWTPAAGDRLYQRCCRVHSYKDRLISAAKLLEQFLLILPCSMRRWKSSGGEKERKRPSSESACSRKRDAVRETAVIPVPEKGRRKQ